MIWIRISDPRTLILIMVDWVNWWILAWGGFISSFDLPWFKWSQITDPDLDHPKETHPLSAGSFILQLVGFTINLRYKVNFDFIIYCFQQAMFIFYTNRTFWEINLIYISTPVHKIWMLIFRNIFKTQRDFIFTCSRNKNLIWIWQLHKLQVNDWNYTSFFL